MNNTKKERQMVHKLAVDIIKALKDSGHSSEAIIAIMQYGVMVAFDRLVESEVDKDLSMAQEFFSDMIGATTIYLQRKGWKFPKEPE